MLSCLNAPRAACSSLWKAQSCFQWLATWWTNTTVVWSSCSALATRYAHMVSIAALLSLTCVLLPSVVQSLVQVFANIAVTIHDGSADATIKRLITHQVDFALASADRSKPDLHYEEILRDRFVLLACGALRERVKPVMTLAELVALPLISMTHARTNTKYTSAVFFATRYAISPDDAV